MSIRQRKKGLTFGKSWLMMAGTALLIGCAAKQTTSFKTDYFGVDIDKRGYITGMWDLTKQNRNFSPTDQPSPLLSLYDEDLKRYY